MGLAVRPQDVAAVLVAGQWYSVRQGSFEIDTFEFIDKAGATTGQGPGFQCKVRHGGAPEFTMIGPLTEIQAVRLR